MIELYNQDNCTYEDPRPYDLIYCDMIYENKDLSWMYKWWKMLRVGGIFIVQTDFHTDYLVRARLETSGIWGITEPFFVNDLKWKNEWGNHPKNRFHQCYDSIIVYSKGKDYSFYPDRIQVPKATAKTKLNPSGRETKTATAWIDDICLTTTSKERVKKKDGHLVRWQKPVKLFDRIIAPLTNEGDLVADPFGGVFSLGVWCKKNNRNYVGIENDPEVFELGKERVENYDVPIQVQQLQLAV